MPTVILLDVSLSMIRPVIQADTGESCTILQLAIHGINFLLDYLTTHLKLEFVSLVCHLILRNTFYFILKKQPKVFFFDNIITVFIIMVNVYSHYNCFYYRCHFHHLMKCCVLLLEILN